MEPDCGGGGRGWAVAARDSEGCWRPRAVAEQRQWGRWGDLHIDDAAAGRLAAIEAGDQVRARPAGELRDPRRVRLGDGDERRTEMMQAALAQLGPTVADLFDQDEVDVAMQEAGIAPDLNAIRAYWDKEIARTMGDATLQVPETDHVIMGGKAGRHTEHMGFILAEMQALQRTYPGARW